jgi:hypothetical protein
MRLILEQPKPNWNLEKIKNHISTFEFKKEFYDDPNKVAIVNWIKRFNEKVGPDGEKLRLGDLLKDLKDTQANRVTDEEYKKRLDEKFPKEKYPYWDFSNVTFRLDHNSNRALDGLYCSKTDKNGQVHGTTDGYKMSDLLSPTKESGCRKCAEDKKSGLKVDFEKYKEKFPKDREYDFSQSSLIPSPPEKTVQPRAFVKDVYCNKLDKYNKPHGLFATGDGVDAYNLLHNKTGCPKCRRNRYKGPASIIKTLVELGYDEDNIDFEWTIEGCISPKSRECRKYFLYFDIRIVDKNGKQILIEYDGIQHFEPNPKRGGEEKFEIDIINDERKNIFTKENNLKLIRIAYTDFKKINDEVIKGLESENQLFLSSTYPQLGWNDPKRAIPTQPSESKIKRDYVLKESQLQRILEIASDEKILNSIKKYVLSRFDEVEDVKFYDRDELQSPTERRPSLTKKVVEIVFDRSKVSFVGMLHNKYEVAKALESFFDIQTKDQDSEWEITIGEK